MQRWLIVYVWLRVGWPSFKRPDSVNEREREREQGQRERDMVYLQKHWHYYTTVMVKPWYFAILWYFIFIYHILTVVCVLQWIPWYGGMPKKHGKTVFTVEKKCIVNIDSRSTISYILVVGTWCVGISLLSKTVSMWLTEGGGLTWWSLSSYSH